MVREFYSNLVGRKDNTVFVIGVWMPYGAQAIKPSLWNGRTQAWVQVQKAPGKPRLKKISEKLTDGKVQLR